MNKDVDFNPEDFNLDPEGIVENIDISEIEQKAQDESLSMCQNLRDIYSNEEFLSKYPQLKARLDVELESLRVLIKMRKSDEIVHDLCLRSIGLNSNNGSLYKALTGIQKSMLNIQIQMDQTVRNIKTLLKDVQLELNFDEKPNEEQPQQEIPLDRNTTRGSKQFIEQMRNEIDNPVMFEDEEEEQ